MCPCRTGRRAAQRLSPPFRRRVVPTRGAVAPTVILDMWYLYAMGHGSINSPQPLVRGRAALTQRRWSRSSPLASGAEAHIAGFWPPV